MVIRAVVSVVVSASVAVLGLTSCASAQTCAIQDLAAGGPAFATPRLALASELAIRSQRLPLRGWVGTDRSAHGLTFRSGSDSVDILKNSGGQWSVAGVTTCR